MEVDGCASPKPLEDRIACGNSSGLAYDNGDAISFVAMDRMTFSYIFFHPERLNLSTSHNIRKK